MIEKKKKKKRTGRPSKLPTIDLSVVRSLAAMGGTDEQISQALSIARSTLSRYKTENEAFQDALKRGKDDADLVIVNSLYKKAQNGDTTAMIFWLKNRRPREWRDRHDIEHGGEVKSDNRLIVEIVKTK